MAGEAHSNSKRNLFVKWKEMFCIFVFIWFTLDTVAPERSLIYYIFDFLLVVSFNALVLFSLSLVFYSIVQVRYFNAINSQEYLFLIFSERKSFPQHLVSVWCEPTLIHRKNEIFKICASLSTHTRCMHWVWVYSNQYECKKWNKKSLFFRNLLQVSDGNTTIEMDNESKE